YTPGPWSCLLRAVRRNDPPEGASCDMLIVSPLDRVADCRRSVRAVRRRVAALVPLFLLSVPPGVSAQQPADPAVAIEGRVTDPQGEPVAGARISATLPSGEVRSAVAGGDGRYRLVIGAGVASRVRVSADGYHAIE